MANVSSLHFAIPAGKAAPEWVHLTPAGSFSGEDGRGPFKLPESTDALISRSMKSGKLAIDENHATDLAAPQGRPAPARGWIVEMAERPDGIWGRVEWTGEGRRLLEDSAYRGISPVFMATEKGGELVQILRASLTNDPNLPLTFLHHRSPQMNFLQSLAALLGLSAAATEDDVRTAITAHAKAIPDLVQAAGVATVKTVEDLAKHLSAAKTAILDKKADAIRAALKAEGVDCDTATLEELKAHLNARAKAGDDKTLRETIVSLQSRLDQTQATIATEKATAYVDAAITAGKPIRALRDHYIARHQKDAAGVEKEIGAMVSIHAGGIVQPPTPAAGELAADEASICALMGVDPKAFKASKAELEKSFG